MPTAGQRVKALDFGTTQSAADFTTFTNLATTATAGSPSVNITFTAPTSGAVLVIVAGYVWDTAASNEIIVDYELRANNVSGAIIIATGNWERRWSGPGATSGAIKSTGSKAYPVTGLTAGSTYFVRTMHYAAVSSAGSNLTMRSLVVHPL